MEGCWPWGSQGQNSGRGRPEASTLQATSEAKSTLGGGYYFRGTLANGTSDGGPGIIPALNSGRINVVLFPGETQSADGLAALEEASRFNQNFASNEFALVSDVRAACAGLQRVNKAIRDGAEKPLREAMEELRQLLGIESTATGHTFNARDIPALLDKCAQATTALDEDSPHSGSDSREHSDLLEELRQYGRELTTLLKR
jgi:hypothetical protein